jgi:TrkA domain protein
MDMEETPLPGIGVRREITLANGRRVGVVVMRDGQIELIVSEEEDPDACAASLPLTTLEAAALGGMLGAPQLVAQLTDQHSELPGVNTQQFVLSSDSPYVDLTLGDTHLRTRTGASVVAVSRAGRVIPSPGPDFELLVGDVLVVVGTAAGLEAAARIISEG